MDCQQLQKLVAHGTSVDVYTGATSQVWLFPPRLWCELLDGDWRLEIAGAKLMRSFSNQV
jgi:hypothetical protein